MRIYKATKDGINYYADDLDDFIEEIKIELSSMETNENVQITIVNMTMEDYDNLMEFDGF